MTYLPLWRFFIVSHSFLDWKWVWRVHLPFLFPKPSFYFSLIPIGFESVIMWYSQLGSVGTDFIIFVNFKIQFISILSLQFPRFSFFLKYKKQCLEKSKLQLNILIYYGEKQGLRIWREDQLHLVVLESYKEKGESKFWKALKEEWFFFFL